MVHLIHAEKRYFPFQPEIQISTKSYIEFKPADCSLSQDIALFYQFKTHKDSPTSLSLIPDGCFDMLFCCSSKNPSAFLWTSPFERRKQPHFQTDCEYFGVRFFPEQGIVNLNISMRELLDRQIPLLDVMEADSFFIEEIAAAKSFEERIRRFQTFIRHTTFDAGYDQKIVDYAIQKMYASHGMLNIRELSRHIGYSEQYIRRKFEEYIGFSPKQFCQIVRFQNSLDCLLKSGDSHLLDIIHENGYYDQAHFIRGFKKMVKVTPKQYKENFGQNLSLLLS